MDFLTKYDATLDCKTKVVRLKNGNSIIKFREQGGTSEKKWISALQADKMLRKGAMGT